MNKSKGKMIIIAIDGYASCGKSTLAKELARKLQYNYIDSGAMYRAVTFYAIQNELIVDGGVDEKKLVKALGDIRISFLFNEVEGKSDTYLNGINIENEIRGLEVSRLVSPVATIKEVRHEMVRQQQEMGVNKAIVMDGRDIGTVVFPLAELKIFMTALPEIRAKRRFDEMKEKGLNPSYEEILSNVIGRDHIDRSRAEGPLKQADDALVLDNSYLNQEEQLSWAMGQVIKIVDDN